MLLSLKTVPKVFLKFEWEILRLYLYGENLCMSTSFKAAKIIGSANCKKVYGPQIANLQIATFAEGS